RRPKVVGERALSARIQPGGKAKVVKKTMKNLHCLVVMTTIALASTLANAQTKDKSTAKQTTRCELEKLALDNRTPIANSFLYWANPAVKADPTYQIFFGPSVQYATYHFKRDFVRWPVGDASYEGTDYAGVDISYWKNIKKPASFFCWDSRDDFIAGYSHGAKAGIAYVGDHHILPGMKVWEHGDNPEGN